MRNNYKKTQKKKNYMTLGRTWLSGFDPKSGENPGGKKSEMGWISHCKTSSQEEKEMNSLHRQSMSDCVCVCVCVCMWARQGVFSNDICYKGLLYKLSKEHEQLNCKKKSKTKPMYLGKNPNDCRDGRPLVILAVETRRQEEAFGFF